jgi:AraC-like DNA-binding protein
MLFGASRSMGEAPVLPWPAALVVWGAGASSSLHRHHCVQLLMALRGQLRIREGARRRWTSCIAAVVQPDAPHEVEAPDQIVLIACFDPESDFGAGLLARASQLSGTQVSTAPPVITLPEDHVHRWREALGDPGALDAARVDRWLRQSLLATGEPPRIHPAVRRAIRALRERIADYDDASLEGLARVAGLSGSRLMHLFTQSVGVPLRPYVRWLRLQRAAAELTAGRTVAEAAHAAGFADAAHLTRTFRQMLGSTPSEVAARGRRARELRVGEKEAATNPSD